MIIEISSRITGYDITMKVIERIRAKIFIKILCLFNISEILIKTHKMFKITDKISITRAIQSYHKLASKDIDNNNAKIINVIIRRYPDIVKINGFIFYIFLIRLSYFNIHNVNKQLLSMIKILSLA